MKKNIFIGVLLSLISINGFANVLFYETKPQFEDTAKGKLLVGYNGLALYTFKKDVNNPIPPKCTSKKDKGPLGSCLARWPAALVKESSMKALIKTDANFGAVYNNELNRLQLTYFGLPVYYWFNDSKTNNFTGDGVGKAWALIEQGKEPIKFAGLTASN